MATTEKYLQQLQTDKSNLIAKYNEKGLMLDSSATFTDIVNEFDNLPSGGGADLTKNFSSVTKLTGSTNYPGFGLLFKKLDSDLFPKVDFTNMYYAFVNMSNLEELDLTNVSTSKVTNLSGAFNGLSKLHTISEFDGDKFIGLVDAFKGCTGLINFGGIKNLGKGYTIRGTMESYALNLSPCTNLTHDSLMNVINNLYNLYSGSSYGQNLVLGSTNVAKLTAEEIAMATNKGWNVS